jgi:hypothetical protein
MIRRILALVKQVVNDTLSIIPTMLIDDLTLVDNTRFKFYKAQVQVWKKE